MLALVRAMDDSLLVLIVNYGLADDIGRLLEAGSLAPYRILLVDNRSQPERITALAAIYGTELVLLDENYGFAGAINRALAQVEVPDHVLLLNPDVELTAGTVETLRAALIERELTAVTPLLLNPGGSIQVGTAGGPVSLASFVAYFLFVSHLVPRARGIAYTRRQLVAGVEPAWLCMACLLLRGDAFARFGPVPEWEVVYSEDVAWGVAASAAGARFAVDLDVAVVHRQGAAGASANWSSALARLVRREVGPAKGSLAAGCMRVGLALRRCARTIGAAIG